MDQKIGESTWSWKPNYPNDFLMMMMIITIVVVHCSFLPPDAFLSRVFMQNSPQGVYSSSDLVSATVNPRVVHNVYILKYVYRWMYPLFRGVLKPSKYRMGYSRRFILFIFITIWPTRVLLSLTFMFTILGYLSSTIVCK